MLDCERKKFFILGRGEYQFFQTASRSTESTKKAPVLSAKTKEGKA
jgi:hypothetical protein